MYNMLQSTRAHKTQVLLCRVILYVQIDGSTTVLKYLILLIMNVWGLNVSENIQQRKLMLSGFWFFFFWKPFFQIIRSDKLLNSFVGFQAIIIFNYNCTSTYQKGRRTYLCYIFIENIPKNSFFNILNKVCPRNL